MCVLLATFERVGGIIVALAWHTPWFVRSLVALVPIALVQRALRAYLRTAAASTALSRIVERSLDVEAEPLGATSVTIIDAAHHASHAVVDVWIPLIADGIGMIAGIAVLATFEDGIVIVGAALFVLGVAFGASRLLLRPAEDLFRHYVTAVEHVADAFDGRVELLASGRGDLFLERARTAIRFWRRTTWLTSANLVRAGSWPAIAGAVAIAVWVLRRGTVLDVRQVLVAGVFAPVAFALVRSAYALSKISAQVSPLRPLFEGRARAIHGAKVAEASRLSWEHATVAFGSHEVLSDVTLEVKSGEALALTGPNGAGKTSMLLAALGLRELSSGTIRVGDAELSTLDPAAWRRRVSYLPQRPYLLPRRTVREAMLFPARDVDDTMMERVLRQVELWERLETFPEHPLDVQTDSLSAGERQRLALARILTGDADVYLLDEVDANLDANGTDLVASLIRRFAARGKIVVYAVHSLALTAAADRVVRLAAGKIVSVENQLVNALGELGH